MANYNYKCKLKDIKGIAFDIDGVLTNGTIIAMPDGELIRTYQAKDGLALRLASDYGLIIGIITGGFSNATVNRFAALGLTDKNIFQKARNKYPIFLEFCKINGLKPEEVAYVGDDLPDVETLSHSGLAVCPADAAEEVKAVCDYISIKNGGQGVARELIEQILKIHNKWVFSPVKYDHKW
ncbi:MAG: HAD hydrolase family protein [Bacteroidales bacterium]